MHDYVFPRLGDNPVDAVTDTDVMAVLLPIWTTKTETAGPVRRYISAVMKWAVAQGHRTDTPTGDAISAALPNKNVQVTHRPALPHPQVGAAVAKVRRSGAYRGAVLSFEFLVLTAARSAEVRGATRDEIDLEAVVWTVPPRRMKGGPRTRGAAVGPGARRARRGAGTAPGRQLRVPLAEGPHAGPSSDGQDDAEAGDRRRAARPTTHSSDTSRPPRRSFDSFNP